MGWTPTICISNTHAPMPHTHTLVIQPTQIYLLTLDCDIFSCWFPYFQNLSLKIAEHQDLDYFEESLVFLYFKWMIFEMEKLFWLKIR